MRSVVYSEETSISMMKIIGLFAGLFAVVSADYQVGTPHKAVVHLQGTSFHEAIKDAANPLWLLKFYAPWCGHCKRMAPVLDKIAPQLEGKMAIGKIDCTVHKPLCNEFKVRGYPTMKYSIDGDLMDYPGGRDEAAIVAFAKKMSGPAVHVVHTYDEALAYASTQTEEGVAFLGFDPRSSADSPTDMHLVFNQVARKKQASAYFVWLTGDERNYQFIHKIELNVQPKSYEDKEVDITTITTDSLMPWVQSYNLPLVSELGPSNFQRVGKNGRPLAVSVVDFDNQEQKEKIKEHMVQYAKTLKGKAADKYYFGVMDGKKFGKFLEQFNVIEAENPQTVIMDVPTKTFWQNSTYGNMFDFMKAIEDGTIESQVATKPTKKGFMGKVERLFLDSFPYSLIVLLLLVFGIVFLLVPSADDMRPPYDQIPEGGEIIRDDADDTTGDANAAPEAKKNK